MDIHADTDRPRRNEAQSKAPQMSHSKETLMKKLFIATAAALLLGAPLALAASTTTNSNVMTNAKPEKHHIAASSLSERCTALGQQFDRVEAQHQSAKATTGLSPCRLAGREASPQVISSAPPPSSRSRGGPHPLSPQAGCGRRSRRGLLPKLSRETAPVPLWQCVAARSALALRTRRCAADSSGWQCQRSASERDPDAEPVSAT